MLGKTNVFLVGPMGSGKTAVGRYLSRLLDLTFHDSDTEIERRTGVDIPFIFEKEGEVGFRQREREAIEVLTAMERIVLATGGGAVLLPRIVSISAERGCVMYLETSVVTTGGAREAGAHPAAAQQRRHHVEAFPIAG